MTTFLWCSTLLVLVVGTYCRCLGSGLGLQTGLLTLFMCLVSWNVANYLPEFWLHAKVASVQVVLYNPTVPSCVLKMVDMGVCCLLWYVIGSTPTSKWQIEKQNGYSQLELTLEA